MTTRVTEENESSFKITEVGAIPRDWDLIPLGELFTFKNGLNKAKEYFGQGTPIVNYMDVYGKAGLKARDLHGRVTLSKQEIKRFDVRKGDVFFTRTSETVDEVGIAAVMLDDPEDAVFSGFVLRARPKDESLTDEYKQFCFSVSSVRDQITSKSTYTTRALTNGRVLSTVMITRPPKEEQLEIAAVIADTDALIESLEKLIAKKRAIKQGAMQELLTGKRRLPGFRGKWNQVRLGDVTNIKTGKKNNENKIADGQYPFFVRSQTVERINTYSFDGEAILVPGEGGIGTIFHYINGRFDYHQRVYRISNFDDKTVGRFVYYSMVLTFNEQAMRNSVKATVDSLRLPTFQSFEFRSPDVPEQTAIVAVIADMEREIAVWETQLAKFQMVKRGMMQGLLTGRIRLTIE